MDAGRCNPRDFDGPSFGMIALFQAIQPGAQHVAETVCLAIVEPYLFTSVGPRGRGFDHRVQHVRHGTSADSKLLAGRNEANWTAPVRIFVAHSTALARLVAAVVEPSSRYSTERSSLTASPDA